LIRQARGADGRLVDMFEVRPARIGHRLRERQLGVRLQPGERSAQLVRRVSEEALLGLRRLRHFLEQPVERRYQRQRLLGCGLGVDRSQVARRARLYLLRQARQRRKPALYAEPDDDQGGERDQDFRQQGVYEDLAGEAGALHHGFADQHGADRLAARREHRHHAHVLLLEERVVRHRIIVRRRQPGISGDVAAARTDHPVIDRVVTVGTQHLLDARRHLEAVPGRRRPHLRADRDADVDERLVVRFGRRLDRREVGNQRPDREQRGDRR
jgi:hypothetical protein